MKAKPQQHEERGGVISVLNGSIEALNLVKEIMSNIPAKAAFGTVSFILTMIRVNHLLAFCCAGYELKCA